MYPRNIHFIKYKTKVLGTSTNLIGFVKHSLAKTVCSNIKYENFSIIKKNNQYTINYLKPSDYIKNKDLLISTQEFDISVYYSHLINMPLCIIDEVVIDKNIKLLSNYGLNIEVDNDSKIEVLESIFNDITIADI